MGGGRERSGIMPIRSVGIYICMGRVWGGGEWCRWVVGGGWWVKEGVKAHYLRERRERRKMVVRRVGWW